MSPLKGWVCPDNGESPGRKNLNSYCVSRCKRPCTAPHVLSAMFEQEKDNPHQGKIISVSQLCGGCKRRTFLERTLNYYLEPDLKLPTFRGSMIHSVVEHAKTNVSIKRQHWLIEHHMELPIKSVSGEWVLSGTLDSYDPKRYTIFDVKTLQEYAVTKLVKGENKGTWSEHISDAYVKQLNLYKYLLEHTSDYRVFRLRLQIIDFGRLILTGTKVKHGYGKNKNSYDVPDIPILDEKLVESWIQEEGDKWFKILYGNASAPVCGTEVAWMCKKCPFNGTEYCPDPDAERLRFNL